MLTTTQQIDRLKTLQANLPNEDGIIDYYKIAKELLLKIENADDADLVRERVFNFLNIFRTQDPNQELIDSKGQIASNAFEVVNDGKEFRLKGNHLTQTQNDILQYFTSQTLQNTSTLNNICSFLNNESALYANEAATLQAAAKKIRGEGNDFIHEKFLASLIFEKQQYALIPSETLQAHFKSAPHDVYSLQKAFNFWCKGRANVGPQLRDDEVVILAYTQLLWYLENYDSNHPWYNQLRNVNLEGVCEFLELQHRIIVKNKYMEKMGTEEKLKYLEACDFTINIGKPTVIIINYGNFSGGHYTMITITKAAESTFRLTYLDGNSSFLHEDTQPTFTFLTELLKSRNEGAQVETRILNEKGRCTIQTGNNCGPSVATALYVPTLLGNIDPIDYINTAMGTNSPSNNSNVWNSFLATIQSYGEAKGYSLNKDMQINSPSQSFNFWNSFLAMIQSYGKAKGHNSNISATKSAASQSLKKKKTSKEEPISLTAQTPIIEEVTEKMVPEVGSKAHNTDATSTSHIPEDIVKEIPKVNAVSSNTKAAPKRRKGSPNTSTSELSPNILTSELTSPLFKFYLNLYLLTSIMHTIRVEHSLVEPNTELKFDKFQDYVTAARMITTQEALSHRGDSLLRRMFYSLTSLCKTYNTICTLLEKDHKTAEIYYISTINFAACNTLDRCRISEEGRSSIAIAV